MTEGRSALIVREDKTFSLETATAADLGGWTLTIQPREFKSSDMKFPLYLDWVMPDLFLLARYTSALVLYQEELTSDYLQEIFRLFRKERHNLPILLIRRENGRGGSLNWAWREPSSRVMDFARDTRSIVTALNKLMTNDRGDRPALTHSS